MKHLISPLCILGTSAIVISQSSTSFAALDDLYLVQRAAITASKGDLSKYPKHLSFQTAVAKTYQSYIPFPSIDLTHEFSFFYDSFKTRGENSLLFPLSPSSEARVYEPALSFEACGFSMSRIHFCGSMGLSLVHIQTTIQNYQMYVGIPAQLRLAWVSADSPWAFEAGARYRAIRNRIEGFVSKHEDTSYFLGIGYLKSSM